jgi:MFS family permease
MSDVSENGRPWTITWLLAVFMLINFLDKIVLGLVAVPMMDELQLTPKQFGDIGSGFFWLFAVGGVLGGFLANRFKAGVLILGMVVIWSVTQLPIGYTTSIWVIIICRAVLGAAQGPAWPVAVHALYKWFPNDRRNLPISIVAQGSTVGMVTAGILIPLVSATWGWRANFVALAVIGCVWASIWLAVGEEGDEDSEDAGTDSITLSYAHLLFDRSVLGCAITHFAGYWSLALALTWLPAYFQRGLGFGAIASGWLYSSLVALMIPLGIGLAWGSERLLKRGISSRTARGRYLSALLMVAGALLAILYADVPEWLRIGLIAIALGCTPIVYSLGPAVLAEVVPLPQRGSMLAIINSVASLAGIAAPVVTGALIQNVPGARGFELGFALCGALMVGGGLLGLWMIDPGRSVRYAT